MPKQTDPGSWGGGRPADGYCHHCRGQHDNPCHNSPPCVCPCNPQPDSTEEPE